MRRLLLTVLAASATSLALPAGALASNDALFGVQWGLAGWPASINAPQAWCASLGAGIVVADIDTGADMTHPDLAGNLIAGRRFTNGDGSDAGTDVNDDVFHGTMTTGIMVAHRDNSIGIAGVAPAARALIVKVLHRAVDSSGNVYGTGSDADVAAGINWATSWAQANNARMVINLSLGPEAAISSVPLTGSRVPPAILNAENHGIAVAMAAGNEGLPLAAYSTSNTHALVVGALNRDGQIPGYSNSLFGVNLYAPGGDGGSQNTDNRGVWSDYLNGQYAAADGTSFAAPHVAGALALLMATGMSNSAAQSRVLATLNPKTSGLDAAAALGTSSGCASAPPTTNNPSHPPAAPPARTPGAPGQVKAPPVASASPSAPPPSASPSEVAQATGTPPAPGRRDDAPAIIPTSDLPPALVAAIVLGALVLVGGGVFLYTRTRGTA